LEAILIIEVGSENLGTSKNVNVIFVCIIPKVVPPQTYSNTLVH